MLGGLDLGKGGLDLGKGGGLDLGKGGLDLGKGGLDLGKGGGVLTSEKPPAEEIDVSEIQEKITMF